MSNQGNSATALDSDQQAEQIRSWVNSLEKLMEAVQQSSIDPDKKTELLLHMASIRNELACGQWPEAGEASALQALAHEAGSIEQIAQDWQVMSVQLAQWIKAISDSLGVK